MSGPRPAPVAKRWWRPALLWFVLVVVGAGCSGSSRNRQAALKEAVTEYCTSMRWGNVEKASHYVPDDLREAFVRQKRAAQAQMTIHEYDVRSVDYVVGTDRARIVILAAWSQPADPVVHQDLLAQQWRFRESRWQLLHQEKMEPVKDKPVRPDEGL